jgi:hypothetical protein
MLPIHSRSPDNPLSGIRTQWRQIIAQSPDVPPAAVDWRLAQNAAPLTKSLRLGML